MNKIKKWLETTEFKDFKIEIASSDASFRKYYRLIKEEKSYILMDSSALKESIPPFIDIYSRLKDVNVNVPKIYLKNLELGYLILEDLGETHYLDILNKENYKELYKKAIDEIIKMQKASTKNLPIYDKEFLLFEMDLMQEWYLEKYLNIKLKQKEQKELKEILENIANIVLTQPQNVFVHRDFHSRNILYKEKVGIIDFQDARDGAITYDLVSLLKDCYIEWDKKEIEELALYFHTKAKIDSSKEEFLKWFDFMGMQRHIKVLGIFARLSLRDKKDGYLKDIPLTLKYTIETSKKYKETKNLEKLLKQNRV